MNYLYRKDKFGKWLIIGHLESNGAMSIYATIRNDEESIEEERKSYQTLYTKNPKIDVYEPLTEERIKVFKMFDSFMKSIAKKK